LLEARFVNRHYALEQPLNLIFIDVDESDVNAKFGKTCTSYETDITSANYSNMHYFLLSLTFKTLRATRVNRVTRKVNLADRSAGYQCHSVFTQA